MLTGPEATIVTRAGGAVLRGVKQQATTSPEWPSLHAGLMELHAIIDQWCAAAEETTKLIQMKLDGEIGQARRTRLRRQYDFGDSVNGIIGNSNAVTVRSTGGSTGGSWMWDGAIRVVAAVVDGEVTHAVHIHESARQQLTPKVSLVKRLSPEQRRKAARRNLRNMMSVYCKELLSGFEEATERRREWVVANESALLEALAAGSVDQDSLRTWAEQARQTLEGLETVRDELGALIREKYPMGYGPLGYQ
jgi:hypothetical protein